MADIRGGEKVGIVGRTGAGKSSMAVLLFRLREAASGTVFVDGVDVSRIGLMTLRKRMAIIPQDPLLIAGTVRRNLDPFSNAPDSKIEEVVRSVGLVPVDSAVAATLERNVSTLSEGEKQLVTLARVFLRDVAILVMDEPTSKVDLETDKSVQRAVRERLAHTTVLTIAHRLATVADGDRIVVMHDGLVVENDRPSVLLDTPSSELYKLALSMGDEALVNLRMLAQPAENQKRGDAAAAAAAAASIEGQPVGVQAAGGSVPRHRAEWV